MKTLEADVFKTLSYIDALLIFLKSKAFKPFVCDKIHKETIKDTIRKG